MRIRSFVLFSSCLNLTWPLLCDTVPSGIYPKLVRPPQGRTNNAINDAIEKNNHMRIVLWSLDATKRTEESADKGEKRQLQADGVEGCEGSDRGHLATAHLATGRIEKRQLRAGAITGNEESDERHPGDEKGEITREVEDVEEVEEVETAETRQLKVAGWGRAGEDNAISEVKVEDKKKGVLDAASIVSIVLERVAVGDIIHFREGNAQTIIALPLIVDGLHALGYELLTVTEMLSYPDDKPH